MRKEINFLELKRIRDNIQQLDSVGKDGFRSLLSEPNLLSITEPVFFDELSLIFNEVSVKNIEGDVMEVGAWNGATAIYMKALLEYNRLSARLWLFDTFEGKFCLEKYKHKKDLKALEKYLGWSDVVYPSVEEVISNFKKFEMFDEKVKILKGDIFDTYLNCNVSEIAILRLDLDFFESTLFMLEQFYPKVSSGGYIIIDDYCVEEFNCKDAVDKFREDNKITNKLIFVGNSVVYWIKE